MKVLGKKLFAAVLAGTLIVCFGGLAACANEPVGQSTLAEEKTEELRVLGSATDDATEIIVQNDTGKDIIGVAIKLSTDTEYGESLVTKKDKIEDGERVLVCIPASVMGTEANADDAAESGANASEKDPAANNDTAADEGNSPAAEAVQEDINPAADVVLRVLYNVQLTFDDDSTAELHNINLEGLEEVTLLLSKDGIAYIKYMSNAGLTESTLETEKALLEASEAEAEAEALAQAEADAAAQAQAEADAAAAASAAEASQGYSYDYGSSNASGGYSGTQTGDTCIPESELILN